MKPIALKVARIGNSRGVRIPARTLERYHIGSEVIMEERSDGILLRPSLDTGGKLSWEETALEMAAEGEDWTAWESTRGDGLEGLPWDRTMRSPRRVSEPKPTRKPKQRRKRS